MTSIAYVEIPRQNTDRRTAPPPPRPHAGCGGVVRPAGERPLSADKNTESREPRRAASVELDAAAEAAAVGRVLAGDVEAYDLLVRAYMRRAYAVAYRILGHAQDAEDAVQDAFFAALERIDTFDTSRRFGPWLMRIVANQAHNQRSSRAVRERGERVDTDTVPSRSQPARDAEDAEVRDAFQRALARLAPRPRTIVQLADVDGFTPTEIAEMLDLSPGTVRGYLFEARQALRRVLMVFHGDGT